jgi:hypothetical protein
LWLLVEAGVELIEVVVAELVALEQEVLLQ